MGVPFDCGRTALFVLYYGFSPNSSLICASSFATSSSCALSCFLLLFVSSPVISDIYLNRFDQTISEAYPSCAYTRYADDIIVSAQGEEAEQTLSAVRETIDRELAERSLKVNEKKTYLRRLKNPGDAIHLLGLNLVRRENERYEITVSDSFLRKTSMDFCEYVSEKDEMDPEECELEFSRVFGRISYVTANSARSNEKLRKMLSVKLNRSIPDLTRETLLEL